MQHVSDLRLVFGQVERQVALFIRVDNCPEDSLRVVNRLEDFLRPAGIDHRLQILVPPRVTFLFVGSRLERAMKETGRRVRVAILVSLDSLQLQRLRRISIAFLRDFQQRPQTVVVAPRHATRHLMNGGNRFGEAIHKLANLVLSFGVEQHQQFRQSRRMVRRQFQGLLPGLDRFFFLPQPGIQTSQRLADRRRRADCLLIHLATLDRKHWIQSRTADHPAVEHPGRPGRMTDFFQAGQGGFISRHALPAIRSEQQEKIIEPTGC